jgi:ADP-heptose:LPS heptosyltransferase
LTLLTGHRCAAIAELCPAIDHVIAVDRVAMRNGPPWLALGEMASLVQNVRRQRFDLVVDFHSFRETNLLTWLSGAPLRVGMKRHKAPYWGFCFNSSPVDEDKGLHVAAMFQKVVDSLPSGVTTKASSSTGVLGRVLLEKAESPTVALYVDAPVPERTWPPERFAEVADYAIEKLQAAVAVISGKQKAELAARVRAASRNPDRLSILTELDIPQLVRSIGSASLLISNDTGPMHIGPAVGVPTLGLFSVGYPEHFRPIGTGDKFLRANPIQEIRVQAVIEMMEQMWATADRGLQH